MPPRKRVLRLVQHTAAVPTAAHLTRRARVHVRRSQLDALEGRATVQDEPLFSISVDTGLEVRRLY